MAGGRGRGGEGGGWGEGGPERICRLAECDHVKWVEFKMANGSLFYFRNTCFFSLMVFGEFPGEKFVFRNVMMKPKVCLFLVLCCSS